MDPDATDGAQQPSLPWVAPRVWAAGGWLREQVYDEGDGYFAALLDAVAAARHAVDLEAYIYRDDVLGRRVADALMDAARRGVRVRIMVDGFGSPGFAARFGPRLREAGVEARVHNPLPERFLLRHLPHSPPLRRLVWLFFRINRRNHRKVCVVDGRTAFVGSMNIAACHLREARGPHSWRDNGIRVDGPDVARLTWAFERTWHQAWPLGEPTRSRRRILTPPGAAGSRSLVRLALPGRPRRRLYRDLLRRMDAARRRIWVTSPYFVPRTGALRALMAAARRGVDVRILIPRKPDVRLAHLTASLFRRPLLHAGVRIFEYMPSVLHAKTLLIDDWATVGSSNFNHRSLIHDLEVDIVVASPPGRLALELQFQRDLERAEEITYVPWHQRWVELLVGRLLLMFRHWI
ncbi:MAG: phospholipase D-like domain-containing protein [Myxococcota bacterium]